MTVISEKAKAAEQDLYRAIGEFIFWFSQLEFTIKARLAGALELDSRLFNIVIGPYDFAVLCTVTEQTLMIGAEDKVRTRIKKYFDKCRGLNIQSRVVIAHGSWTTDGVRHLSRQSLQAEDHFRSPAEIRRSTQLAKRLMHDLFSLGATHRLSDSRPSR